MQIQLLKAINSLNFQCSKFAEIIFKPVFTIGSTVRQELQTLRHEKL